MNTRAHQLVFAFVLVFAFSCKKDDAIKQTVPDVPKISINGITAYDNLGNLTGPIDTLDWLTNDEIPTDVEALLSGVKDQLNYTGVSDLFKVNNIQVYPNPFKEYFYLRIEVSDVAVLKLVVVDEYLNAQASVVTKLAAGENALQIALPNAKPKSLYRMYYQFYNNNKKVNGKGFGDIQKL